MIPRRTLLAIALGSAAIAAPSVGKHGGDGVAMAQEAPVKKSQWVKKFESEYTKWSEMLALQIERNHVYASDVKKARREMTYAISGIKAEGQDTAPYTAKMEAFMADVQTRIDAAALVKKRKDISRDYPVFGPAPGIEKIPLGPPSWCGDIVNKYHAARKNTPRAVAPPGQPEGLNLEKLGAAAYFACDDPEFEPTQKWTQAYRQQVSNLMGLSQAENNKLFAHVTATYVPTSGSTRPGMGPNPDAARCSKFPLVKDGLPEVRASRELERYALGCSKDSALSGHENQIWVIDGAGGVSTEFAKVGLVRDLLTNNGAYLGDLYAPGSAGEPVVLMQNYALARTIKLDKKALEKEIMSSGWGEAQQWEARFKTYGVYQGMRNIGTFVDSWLSANPAYKAVLIDGPEGASVQNAKEMKDSRELLDMVLAIEDRIGPRTVGGLNGCAKALFPAYSSWIKARAKKDKVTKALDLEFDDYRGSLILYAMYHCGRNDEAVTGLSFFLADYYRVTPTQHGPLAAAYAGMMSKFGDVSEKQSKVSTFSASRRVRAPKFKFESMMYNPIQRPKPIGYIRRGYLNPQTGVVGKVKKRGDRVEVTFKMLRYRIPVYKCHDTNRPAYVRSNGVTFYHQKCVKAGTEEIKETNDPISIPAWAAGGIKKGVSLTYVAKTSKQGTANGGKGSGVVRPGWPKEIYKSKKQKKLIGLLGVKL